MADDPNVNTNATGEGEVTPPAPQPTPQPTQPAQEPASNLRTFTQEQLDAIISRERSKATKGWFSAEQMAAKDNSIATLTSERDSARADNQKLQDKINAYEHEKFLQGKGVPANAVDFYAFKIGQLVTDKKTFEQAAEEYLKDNPPVSVTMSTAGGVGGGGATTPKPNDLMNAIIRGQK